MTEHRCRPLLAQQLPTWQWTAEVLASVVLLFLLGSGPAPEVNEAHYLAKAKHFWDPRWCPRDFFLNSADAHVLFYAVFGGLTRWCSLATTAWIGRLTAWLLLAVTWHRLSWSLVPRWGCALLSLGIWTALTQRFHMSGEWIVGGIEAKVPAYALVVWGLADICRGHWSRAWIKLGAAAAFHVLVGGWTVVIALCAWTCQPRHERPRLLPMVPALAVGGLLSLPGLLPAWNLSRQVDPTTAAAACEVYVFDRLQHHLLLSAFDPAFVSRHLLLAAVFVVLAWQLRRERGYFRLACCVGGAMLLALCGSLLEFWEHCALLRLYWFRPTDAMVPLGVALGVVLWSDRCGAAHPRASRCTWVAAILLLSLHVFQMAAAAQRSELPAADRQGQIFDHDQLTDWREACRWLTEHTASDACVLSPWDHQTFKWYAGRSEVVTWKDVPQDAAGIVEWQQRRQNIVDLLRMADAGSPDAFRDRLRQLAERYGFEYWLVRRGPWWPTRGLPLEFRNRSYAIYRITP